MRNNKMGVMFLVTILALAGIGISYAGWTDIITVEGTVTTGDVDWDLIWVSGTWVYKVPDAQGEIVVQRQCGLAPGVRPQPPAGFISMEKPSGEAEDCVAYAEAYKFDAATETLYVEWYNLFPCVYFCIDFLWHYVGSIPAKVNDISATVGADSDMLIADLIHGATMVRANADGDPINVDGKAIDDTMEPYDVVMRYPDEIVIVEEGTQLHKCDYVYCIASLHIPQNNIYQDLSGSATLKIELVQWNEFPYVAP
jgi:hypothetical protein